MNLIKNYTEKIAELEAKRDDVENRGMASPEELGKAIDMVVGYFDILKDKKV